MPRGSRMLLAAVCLALTSALRAEDGFLVRLGLKNGHVRELYFGCAQGATAGYDPAHDDLAPPRGIETGYTVLLSPDRTVPPLFKDVRAPADRVTWDLLAEVHTGKPIRLEWSTASAPKGYRIELSTASGTVDMSAADRLELAATETVKITATRVPAGETGNVKKEERP